MSIAEDMAREILVLEFDWKLRHHAGLSIHELLDEFKDAHPDIRLAEYLRHTWGD